MYNEPGNVKIILLTAALNLSNKLPYLAKFKRLVLSTLKVYSVV